MAPHKIILPIAARVHHALALAEQLKPVKNTKNILLRLCPFYAALAELEIAGGIHTQGAALICRI